MSELEAETGGNPGADAGSSFLAGIASDVGTTGAAPQSAPDTTTAEGIQQAVADGPPEGVPSKFWDAETKSVKVEDLTKGYTNLEKLLSREKVPVPQGDDDQEGLDRWFSAVRPESEDAYDFGEPPKEMPAGLSYDDELEQSFRNAAFANGLHPKQAKALHDMFVKGQVERVTQYNKMQNEQKTRLMTDLQREHGAQFPAVLQRSKSVLGKYANPDFIAAFEEYGLANDARIINVFDRIGRDMQGESKLVGNAQPTASHADIDQAISQFTAKNNKALFDKSHPDHNRLVAERAKLFEAKYGDQPA